MNLIWILGFILFPPMHALALDLNGSLGQLPVISDSQDKGILVQYIKAMQKAYMEGKITFVVQPFKRSLDDAVSGKKDFHGPILKHPSMTERELGFAYSTSNIWSVVFAIYTNRDKPPIDLNNLGKYNIETDAGHTGFFDFKIHPTTCLSCSLKKLSEGRIDGFIFAAMESDSIIKTSHIKNLRSHYYKKYEGKFVLPLGERGKLVDKELSKITDRLKKSGEDKKSIGLIEEFYKNWKPSP